MVLGHLIMFVLYGQLGFLGGLCLVQGVCLWMVANWALSFLIVVELIGLSWFFVGVVSGVGVEVGVMWVVVLTCGAGFGLSGMVREGSENPSGVIGGSSIA
uniref:Uncharacterized protein n=1 Tax=Graffilla buccinicola TaxID=84095 RepID=A0A7G5XUI7_9PLAT|nr:hypothetical protein ICI27_mgp12 [Graffilla buccinicola]QNA49622.1 hypothetical protein [Graffilla buccinicola]